MSGPRLLLLGAALLLPLSAHGEEGMTPVAQDKLPPEMVVGVAKLDGAPTLDGDLSEWGTDGWNAVPVQPAIVSDDNNRTGELTVQLKAAVNGDTVYLALRWPDDKADTDYRPWKWKKDKYKREKDRDDMLVLRFHMDGEYYYSMLSPQSYRVDLWQWSAGRSNAADVAEDYVHQISAQPLESAAEYQLPGGGMVYIRKIRDEGDPPYDNSDPGKENKGNEIPGIQWTGAGSGSLVDVKAKGVWADGHWNLELSRKLDTGHADDLAFTGASKVVSQIAVFNAGYAEHKSISGLLVLDFSAAF